MHARLGDLTSADVVTPELRARLREDESRLIAVYSPEQVSEMRSWKTWAGPFTLQEMARRAAVPGVMYNLMYRVDSRAVHARDAGYYVEARGGEGLAMRLPEQVEQHLMPASSCVVTTLKLIGEKLGVNRDTELEELMTQIQRVAGV